jgi:Nitronate monooxygenase
MPVIETALTRLLEIEHPILLAPMGSAAGGKLAAAVTNAGALGMIGSAKPTRRQYARSSAKPATPGLVSDSSPGRSNEIPRLWTWHSMPDLRP